MSGLDKFIYNISSILVKFWSILVRFKKIIIGVFILAGVLTVVLAAVILSLKHRDIMSKQIEDINGEDTALCVITDEMIESWKANYDIYKEKTVIKRDIQSGVEGKYAKFDGNEVLFETKIFTGIFILNSYLANDDSVTFRVDSKIIKGNSRIVLTDEESRILCDVPVNQEYTFSYATEEGKIYYLKIVGESAECNVSVFRNEDS